MSLISFHFLLVKVCELYADLSSLMGFQTKLFCKGGACFMPTCTNETTRKWLHECEYSNGSGPSIPAEILIISIHIHRTPRKNVFLWGYGDHRMESPPAPIARCHWAAFRTPRPSAPAPSCQPTPRHRRRRGARRRRSRCSATDPSSACLGWAAGFRRCFGASLNVW